MKRVLITGPIGGHYGRDIEVNLVAKSLYNHFELNFFSTGSWQNDSSAIRDLKKPKYSSLNFQLLKNPIVFFFTCISWIYNGFKTQFNDCIYNKINKLFIKKYKWDEKILKSQIKQIDLVICFVQLSSKYLDELIYFSNTLNKRIVVRTTGTIQNTSLKLKTLENVDLFIHHSASNKNLLERHMSHRFKIIDQCTLLEEKLLSVSPLKDKDELVFGFLGRYNEIKGIDEIIKVAIELDLKLIIAGDGELKKAIKTKIENISNITDLGHLDYNSISNFFELIDIFIINSKHETGPLSGLEAMCAGRFIISRKVGAMPKRLENNNNQWIESNLKNSIHDVLKLDRKKIIKIGAENRKIYIDNYNLKHIQKEYLLAVKSLTNA